jgi:hypothetical protein
MALMVSGFAGRGNERHRAAWELKRPHRIRNVIRGEALQHWWANRQTRRMAASARISVPTRRLNAVDLGEVLDAAPEWIRRTNLPRLGRDHDLVTL